MLTYLINVTDDLLAVAVVLGIMFAYIRRFCGQRGKIVFLSVGGFGLIAAAVRTYITNTRRLVGGWRVGTIGYGLVLAALLIAVIAYIIFNRKLTGDTDGEKVGGTPEIVIACTAGLLAAAYFYSVLPSVYYYPFKFDTSGDGVLSSDFLLKLGGYLLGLIVCAVSAASAFHVADVLSKKGKGTLVQAAYLVTNVFYTLFFVAKLLSVLIVRSYISSKVLFSLSTFSNNHQAYYTYILFALVAAMAVYLLICSKTAKEPYRTNAEHRKQKAIWRTGKRYTASLAVCLVMAVLCSTLFVTLNTVVIKEAPVEEPIIVKDGTGADSEVRVPLDMVSDGHLHRFGYTTADGVQTRFIVILKQENTNNYGVGLDACEICGIAGYYENNDGQVVCKKCNVIMNTTTIGMKGGCNPIIIEYDIDDEGIVIPVSELVNNESRFK